MISVAVATYNGEAYIIEQLESIRSQDQPADEVIIIDDASTDATALLVRTFIAQHHLDHWTLMVNQNNLGYVGNFAKAIRLCRGDLILPSDQDDRWYPEKIRVMSDFMAHHEECMAACHSFQTINAQGDAVHVSVANGKHLDDGQISALDPRVLVGANTVRGCTLIFRRRILLGAVMPKMSAPSVGHDWWILVKAIEQGPVFWLHELLMDYRLHDDNTSTTRKGNTKAHAREKRITGLNQQLMILEAELDCGCFPRAMHLMVKQTCTFLKRRKRVVVQHQIWYWPLLLKELDQYQMIYGTRIGGLRVWLGDLISAC